MNDNFFVTEILQPTGPNQESDPHKKRRGAFRVFLPAAAARAAVTVAMTGTLAFVTISTPHPAQSGNVIFETEPLGTEVGRSIANLLQFRAQPDEPTDDDIFSRDELL